MVDKIKMQNALKFYINGEWVDPVSPDTLDVINPATEQAMGHISLGGVADVDRAVTNGINFQIAWNHARFLTANVEHK